MPLNDEEHAAAVKAGAAMVTEFKQRYLSEMREHFHFEKLSESERTDYLVSLLVAEADTLDRKNGGLGVWFINTPYDCKPGCPKK